MSFINVYSCSFLARRKTHLFSVFVIGGDQKTLCVYLQKKKMGKKTSFQTFSGWENSSGELMTAANYRGQTSFLVGAPSFGARARCKWALICTSKGEKKVPYNIHTHAVPFLLAFISFFSTFSFLLITIINIPSDRNANPFFLERRRKWSHFYR